MIEIGTKGGIVEKERRDNRERQADRGRKKIAGVHERGRKNYVQYS